jgi:hypothetical protein
LYGIVRPDGGLILLVFLMELIKALARTKLSEPAVFAKVDLALHASCPLSSGCLLACNSTGQAIQKFGRVPKDVGRVLRKDLSGSAISRRLVCI